MRCSYTFDDINEYADGAVPEERADAIKAHLEACKACGQYYDSIFFTEKYIKNNMDLKCDMRMKVLESIDVERYKSKKILYRLGWIRNKTGLIKKLVVAGACVFLAVFILGNEYTGTFIRSEISRILEQKQQNTTVPVDNNEGVDSPVETGEALFFENVEDITANMPEFIDVKEAMKILKTRPVGVEPWQIECVSEDYVYITYNVGIEFIFRYNIKENIIDRALDLRSLHKGNLTTHTSFRFLSNGLYAYFTTGNRDTGTTFQDVYKVDFSNQSVVLLAETADNFWRQSFSEEYYKKEEYGKSADKYLSRVDENPKLPKLYDWSTVAQIDEDRFFVIMPNELPSPGDGYYYFKILIINVSNNEVIKEYRFSSIENVEAEDSSTKDITQILYEYAEDIRLKNYSQAYEKLGTNLKNSYSGGDDKAF